MKTPVIDFIVTHYDEPWEIGRPFFEMLRLQRNIDFRTIHVILVQDGEEYSLDFPELMKQYQFTTTLVTINHSGTAAARNAGLKHSTAEWVMFCDWDDMLADVAAVKCIMNVLPTDDADIIWMKNFREEKTRATNPEKNGVFINCLDEHFFSTDSKLYRRKALEDNNIRFNPKLTYEYESAFNHLALSIIPSFRVMGLTSEFRIYMKTMRDNSLTTRRDTLRDRLLSVILRDLHLADEYEKRGIMPVYRDMIAETIFDMYFLVNNTPKMDMPDEVMDRFREFCISSRGEFNNTGNVEKEVVLDNCINRMLSTVQTLYNHYGIEIIPPPEDIGHVNEWLDKVTDEKDTYAVMDEPSAPSVEQTQLSSPVRSGKYAGPRIVIYCGTYNTYVNMIASAKSLLAHTHVDQIFFLTEDDTFPYQLPDIIQNINVSNQKIFPQGGPNYDNVWSYMCMMRAAFPQMFKEYDRALSLDIDIIVNEDIGHLWDLPLDDYYYAGVPEPCRQKTSEDPVYCNFGVIMMNLDKIRLDGKDAEAIYLLNHTKLGCPEQDAFNRVCAHHIYALPPDYNFTPFSHITGEPEREIITHYAGIKYWKHFAPVRKYATMTWDELVKKKREGVEQLMFLQRYDIINKFITARNYKSFLEIGTDKGEAFKRINIQHKVAVDPDNSTPATNHVTSDAFFASTQDKFDIIFIDGLHEHNQVMRDIHNSLAHLAPNGVIILHDCNPSTEAEQCYSTVSLNDRVWLGTVWKAYVATRATLPYEMCVLVPNNGDSSCGIIDTNRPKVSDTSALPTDMDAMTWADFRNHPEWLNFRSYYDFSIQEHHEPKPRIAFMFGTRDWYHRMVLSLKSLLKHTYLDRIYFMIEDDFFPEPLPPFVQCVNVSKQQYFPEDGPNYKSIYSYMVLLRPVLPIMFPDIDLALCIDADTLTRGDIGPVFDTDMSDNYLAAVKELRALHGCDYYNCGFMLMNFANMRRDNIPEQSIKILNEQTFRWKEQDVLNDFCRYHIHSLPSTYNHAPGITGNYGDQCLVRHYIGNSNVKTQMLIDAKPYEHMSWTEIKQER